jgi:hypothetical protein
MTPAKGAIPKTILHRPSVKRLHELFMRAAACQAPRLIRKCLNELGVPAEMIEDALEVRLESQIHQRIAR